MASYFIPFVLFDKIKENLKTRILGGPFWKS
jgi:hypothetical protein